MGSPIVFPLSRIRRKKCDEEKPTCRRCRDSQVKCDGYAFIPPKKKPTPRKHSMAEKKAMQAVAVAVDNVVNQCRPSLNYSGFGFDGDTGGNTYDRLFFHHFCAITIVEFVRLANPQEFWSQRVLPMCHKEPAIRHAIVALGAAHYVYLQKLSKTTPADVKESMSHYECVATSFYNKAIGQLVSLNGIQGPALWEAQLTMMTCCLLFVCLENIFGRFEEGVRHMQAGARLFEAFDLSSAPPRMHQIMQEIATVLCRFCVDAFYLTDEYVIPNMTPYAPQLVELDDSPRPFLSLTEAKDAMWDLDVKMSFSDYEEFWPSSASSSCPSSSSPASSISSCSSTYTSTSPCFSSPSSCSSSSSYMDSPPKQDCGGQGCDLQKRLMELCEPFERWKTNFNLLIATQLDPSQSNAEVQRELLILSVRRCLWDILLFPDEDTTNPELLKLYNELIEMTESLYSFEDSWLGRPMFTLDSDSIPALYFVATTCENPALIERITRLLRGSRRREGPWDSCKVADKIEVEVENPNICCSYR
ncbi:uncharacterized protein SETTUDRAFT_165750 [Exserohilum turcica Et28A]|uniref:Zn(2)-C6 fungal-type domain-containing protein n=1 Tax=Exserohilum turcicum (strain 28A) TaxID=671987 RepID=R0IA46_EXST2|nr:uncharacterized protein SETTUDRAFT_165750 [Exserohilum turcica Et28A]EOA82345.1 hypothetical protein SETTUDRAFT_165750 [Exserohilum turcica Et28A]